ncbi:MAG: homocysteine S-methyltransferase family protein [Oscillospiraceae bacterium]|nr:homocysteine S-methyltransferase family protein [Oscillospiraceae bacterium]
MALDLRALARERVLFFDCGTGTTLQARGLGAGRRPELWSVEKPEILVDFHRQCLAAGAEMLKINTFGANAAHFPPGEGFPLRDLIFAAVRNAREAIVREGREGSAWVAFDMGPTGQLLAPFGDLPLEEAVALFREAAGCGAAAGADLILAETMGDTLEAKAALLGARLAAPSLPLALTMTFEESGRLLTGGTPEAALLLAEAFGVQAFGVNCGAGPARVKQVLGKILPLAQVPVIANPNAGLPIVEGGQTRFAMPPAEFAAQCAELFDMGAALLGGCCGTTPAHIAALTGLLRGKTPLLPQGGAKKCACSARRTVNLTAQAAEACVLAEADIAEALQSGDAGALCDTALDAECDGAALVEISLPGDADPQAVAALVGQLQCAVQLPLCFRCEGAIAALEAALLHTNGVPLVFAPGTDGFVKRYGAIVGQTIFNTN